MNEQILREIRVVDFSRYIAGPYCAALLGHLGAEVVRVDKPTGSEDRFVTPLNKASLEDESIDPAGALFQQTGANKRSVTLDLKHPQAQNVVQRLVGSADVVVANMPPAALRRVGLDYDTLCSIKPDIILTTQTGYGHKGPWANRGGFDGVGQAMSGAAYFGGTPGKPIKSAAPYADFGTALFGAFATLGALYEKKLTGRGQHVQASLLGTALSFFNPLLTEHAVTGLVRQPSATRGQTSAPSDIFATKDGHVLIHVVGDGLFRRIAELVGKPEWIERPEFNSDQARGDAADELCGPVADWCAARTSEQALDAMADAGVPCGPVLPIANVLEHEQIQAMGFFNAFNYPGLSAEVPVANFPVEMSLSEVGQKRRAPTLGEHTDEVLTELGYAAGTIQSLREAGVI